MQHPRTAALAGGVSLAGRLLTFQRVVEHNLYLTGGSKGKLWNTVLRKGMQTASVGFYVLLAINTKWVGEWLWGLTVPRKIICSDFCHEEGPNARMAAL
jgi:hypothetical protein